MKNAAQYWMEPLLTQFFLIDAICRDFLDEDRRFGIFQELAGVFCVPLGPETEAYYQAANSGQYSSLTDSAAYERLCRIIEFAQLSGQSVEMTAMDRVILAQKREALQIKSQIFRQSRNLTPDMIVDTLLDTAGNGNIDAMVTLAYMEYHGICICRDRDSARKRWRLCAKWNNLFGNLMGIAYDPDSREEYYNTLYTVLRGSYQQEMFQYLCAHTGYSADCDKNPVARILEKAFGLGIVKRSSYDQIFAKIAFSELVSTEDKEKLLLSKKKDAIVSLSDIPFDAKRETVFSFSKEKARQIPLCREEELHRIFCGLSPAMQNREEFYRPVLIAGNDAYVSDMYAGALKAGFSEGNKVIEVDASMLTARDFVGARENFLLRGLSETKQSHTVFLITHCEELGEEELEELEKLLEHSSRRRFKLLEPPVCLDLSDVLLVLVASRVNGKVRKLADACDAVWTARLSEKEKQAVIESMFDARAKSFGIGPIRMENAGVDYLAEFSTGQILRMIDGALKRAAYDHETVVTVASLQDISRQQNIHAGKREFGYLGGAFHETC